MRVLRGKLVSGKRNFSYWIDKLHDYYFRKTGLHLFPGTLNVMLSEPYTLPEKVIRTCSRKGDLKMGAGYLTGGTLGRPDPVVVVRELEVDFQLRTN